MARCSIHKDKEAIARCVICGKPFCDLCLEGKLQTIKNPPIKDFLEDIATFMGMEVARPTAGSRMAMNVVFKVLANSGDTVILDGNAHYTTYLAAEDNNVNLIEVQNNGYPEFIINEEDYAKKIEEVKKNTGKLPAPPCKKRPLRPAFKSSAVYNRHFLSSCQV